MTEPVMEPVTEPSSTEPVDATTRRVEAEDASVFPVDWSSALVGMMELVVVAAAAVVEAVVTMEAAVPAILLLFAAS